MAASLPGATSNIWLPFVSGGSGKPPTPPKTPLPSFTGLGSGIPHQVVSAAACDSQAALYKHIRRLLKPKWWYNWKWDQINIYGNVPMLWRQKWDWHAEEAFVVAANQSHIDKTWLVGNEPMVEGQAIATPQEAADLSQRWRREIPDVKFACPGVYHAWDRVYPWLNDYLDAGGPVPDFWHVHCYAWTGPQAMTQNDKFFEWLTTNDVMRPVIISEINMYNDTDWREQVPMLKYCKLLLEANNPVVAIGWFAAQYNVWPTRMLMKPDLSARSELGTAFREIVDAGISVQYNDE